MKNLEKLVKVGGRCPAKALNSRLFTFMFSYTHYKYVIDEYPFRTTK